MPTAKEMAILVKGSKFQVTLKTIVRVRDEDFCIYGKSDCLKPKEILDIKVTTTYKNEDYYLNGNQHIFYLFTAKKMGYDIKKFTYLVTDLKEIHKIVFEVDDWDLLNIDVYTTIQEFLSFLDSKPDLKKAYNEVFCY